MKQSIWLVLGLVLSACGGGGTSVQDDSTSNDVMVLPANFPAPRLPADNALSAEKVELGRFLFYDKRLSGNGTQSCASCHHQDKAFTDGLARSIGSTEALHPRNAQSLANVVYNITFTWANPSLLSLESQMQVPLFGEEPIEMGINESNMAEVLARIGADARYTTLFQAAFPALESPITFGNITRAIASFQRTLISGNSRFDQALQGKTQLSAAEKRGQNLFFGEKAECFHCHVGFNFNDQVVHASTRVLDTPFHNTGLYNIAGTGNFPEGNQGLFEFTAQARDRGLFRAQSLRNVELTAPYMHDGSISSLEEVLEFYAAGGRVISSGPNAGDGRMHPNKSDLVTLINLSRQEQSDIVAFLKTLTDHEFVSNSAFSNPF
ncbi:methanobactin biosynthesis cassette protein MbnH [Paraperlucidibaca baekdonensis]|uniref:Methanobactin biosynthesis cassette protein MbnH n=1 Tax=Paraperlucidibaca baekdonensis TaxID=748120 RepID=A0A3E0H8E3_9GAMM|nr:methanobactin export MATE transporter MbnM [Paraperlucidibaca baekdonensis]REH39116.1 methanobactin biosynthesis cassette protein MbnH [Paraperlucidibaca baekdonensis]